MPAGSPLVIAMIEIGRDLVGLEKAGSAEFDFDSPHPVIHLMEEQKGIANLGATREAMRVAARMAEPRGTASSERARLLNECMATGERSEAA